MCAVDRGRLDHDVSNQVNDVTMSTTMRRRQVTRVAPLSGDRVKQVLPVLKEAALSAERTLQQAYTDRDRRCSIVINSLHRYHDAVTATR